VERRDGTCGVLLFDKHGRTLTLTPVRDEFAVKSAKKLIDIITATVYKDSQARQLHERYNFSSYLEN
jgi:hypothetical protein